MTDIKFQRMVTLIKSDNHDIIEDGTLRSLLLAIRMLTRKSKRAEILKVALSIRFHEEARFGR